MDLQIKIIASALKNKEEIVCTPNENNKLKNLIMK